MKKKTAVKLSLVVALIAIVLIGGTLSYFTDDDEVVNKLELGDLTVSIGEPEWEKDPDKDKDREPGDTLVKDPLVTAVKNDMYFRIKMTVNEIDGEGKVGALITDTTRLNLILKTLYLDTDYKVPTPVETSLKKGDSYTEAELEALINTNKIFSITNPALFQEDSAASTAGTYYYNYIGPTNGVLKQGEKAYFMSHVVIPSDWGSEEFKIMKGYHVTFKVEAIQSKGFNSVSEAMAALKAELAGQ